MSRIVFICRRFCSGEAWTNRLLAYAKGFAEQGMEVCLMFLITDEKRTPYSIKIPNVKVFNLWEDDGSIARLHRLFSYLKNKRRIARYLRDGDVCFMFDASGFYLNEVQSSFKNVKIVYEATEHPVVLSGGNDKNIKKLFCKLQYVDCLFTISHSLRNFFIDNGILHNKVSIINMFVDTTRFSNLEKTEDRKYIAYCGNVSYEKDGVDILIQAFAKFKINHPDFTLEIYGRSVGNSIERLVALADKCNVKDSVLFTGMIPFTEIPQRLKNATLLALARPNNLQNQHGFPTKLGEYLMTGNPVVVTSVGEIPLFIQDGENGYLAECDNIDSFSAKLEQAASDLEQGINVGAKAKELAFTEFSYTTQTQKALELISINKQV